MQVGGRRAALLRWAKSVLPTVWALVVYFAIGTEANYPLWLSVIVVIVLGGLVCIATYDAVRGKAP